MIGPLELGGPLRGRVALVRGELREGGRVDFESCGDIVFLEDDFTWDVNNASSKNPQCSVSINTRERID